MKNLLLVGLFGFINASAYANTLPENVVAEHRTFIHFSLPELTGDYKLQILSNGVVQKIDNKNHTTLVATLSEDVLNKVKENVENIKSNELIQENTRPCTDAPSEFVTVRQSNGMEIEIWRRVLCLNSESSDSTAKRLAGFINSLENSFSRIP